MNLAAALRHERTCAKHLEKVKEAAINDWTYEEGACDWGPQELPAGSTAWEESYPADRADDFINYWLDNVQAAEREEPMETMDSFIDRFNAKYLKWLQEFKQQTVEWRAEGGRDANPPADEPAEQYDGVRGYWYSGGSFEPHDEGWQVGLIHGPPHSVPHPSSCYRRPKRRIQSGVHLLKTPTKYGGSPETR